MRDIEAEIMARRGCTLKTRPKCVTCDYYISHVYDPWCVRRRGTTSAKTSACDDYLVRPGLENPDKIKQIKEELKKCKTYVL